MYSVEFAYNIVPSDEAGQGLSNLLIRQLAAIESGKGLQQAARSLGVSYRYFWGQIEIWEERFGQKLVIREQGKRARLSPLGQKLLWAERTVMANYAVQMEKMRTELNAAFAAACNPDADIVTIAARLSLSFSSHRGPAVQYQRLGAPGSGGREVRFRRLQLSPRRRQRE